MRAGWLRSLLFMPANNARAHEKAANLPADALIFDLEDAVAPAHKQEARQVLGASLRVHDYGARRLFLRINHPDSGEAQQDIALLAGLPQIHCLVIPKVESGDTIEQVSLWMDEAGCPRQTTLAVMLETPRGVLDAAEFLRNRRRVSAVIAGTNDLAADMRLPAAHTRDGLRHALMQMVLVARANGSAVYDGVFNDIADHEGFLAECLDGRRMGFDGKTLIHPAQIESANRSFSPDAAELEEARAIITAWEAQKQGVIRVNGRMVEELHVRAARDLLAFANTAR